MEPGGRDASFAGRRRAGLLLAGLAGWLLLTMAIGVLVAPAGFALVDALAPGRFPFQRVFRRITQLVALLLLFWGLRRVGVRSLDDVGLGRGPGRGRQLLVAAGIAACAFAAVILLELAAGVRVWSGVPGVRRWVGFLVGIPVIALLEEGISRGALLFPFGRLRGAAFLAATTAVSALYSIAHFARGKGIVEGTDWRAAWSVWTAVPPAARSHAWALLGLFLAGFFLHVFAWRQGHAWGAVGLHAGALVGLQLPGACTAAVADARPLLLVDGLLPGPGVSLLLAIGIVVLLAREPRPLGAG